MIRHALLSFLLLALAAPAAAQSMRTGGEPVRPGFGTAIEITGGQVLVAEPNGVRSPGAVYVYGEQGGSWSEIARLQAENPASDDLFGASIAASGDRLIAGALGSEGGGAYVFVKEGDGWRRVARLTATDVAPSDSFGASVAIAGDVALVGAGGADSGRGAVYVFRGDLRPGVPDRGRVGDRAPAQPRKSSRENNTLER